MFIPHSPEQEAGLPVDAPLSRSEIIARAPVSWQQMGWQLLWGVMQTNRLIDQIAGKLSYSLRYI